jgi:cyclopropane-fatty-acyl-phospholipid synthase
MTDSLHARLAATLTTLFRDYDGPPFALRLWDGWSWAPPWLSSPGIPPECILVLRTPEALEMLLLGARQVALGEAFLHKQLDVEGDLFSVFAIAEHLLRRPMSVRRKFLTGISRAVFGICGTLAHGFRHSPVHDSSSIAYHYDQPVDFFRAFLGPTLVYSCAYFVSPSDSLDQAQTRKLELICRKLRLGPGERFLDIGCGWGGLILHAAQHWGADATGITLSRQQEKTARQRIADVRLGSCCRVRFQNYRQLDPAREQYDKIASVGMAEHVGLKNLPVYFRCAHQLLRPGGVFLNHAIARSATGIAPRGHDSFINRYVFPDGELVTPNQTIRAAESAGFEVRDVENLREHYELTLRCWVEALRQNQAALLRIVPETTYRIWLLYMAGCAAAFRSGDIAVYQTLLSRPDRGRSRLPLTREDWYTEPADGNPERTAAERLLSCVR